MRGNTRSRIAGVAVAGMAVVGVAAVSSMSASGAELPTGPEAGPFYTEYGTLTIDLIDRDGTYELTDPDGAQIEIPDPESPDFFPNPETIATTQPCATILPNTGNHLVLTPNPASTTNEFDVVQLRDNGLGVNTGNTSCGASAASLISGAEQLKFDLGPILPDNVFVEFATIEWTQNKSGDLTYTLPGGQTETINVGRNAPAQSTTAAADFDASGNVVVESVDDLFKSITVESTAKKNNEGISIMDGTSFNLVQIGEFEAAVDCLEQVTESDGVIADSAVFFRLENKDEALCEEVGVTVEIVTNGAGVGDGGTVTDYVFWDNEFTGVEGTPQPGVLGLVTIEWAPVPVVDGMATVDLDRKIDYDGPGAGGASDTLWCESFEVAPDGTVTAERPAYSGAGAVDDGTGTGTMVAPWCLVSDERVLEGGFIYQTEVLFGGGDPARW